MPPVDRCAVFKTVEAQIGGGQHFGQHDDLAGVHREVFGDVKDCFEGVDVRALDRAPFEKRFGAEIFKNRFDVR